MSIPKFYFIDYVSEFIMSVISSYRNACGINRAVWAFLIDPVPLCGMIIFVSCDVSTFIEDQHGVRSEWKHAEMLCST